MSLRKEVAELKGQLEKLRSDADYLRARCGGMDKAAGRGRVRLCCTERRWRSSRGSWRSCVWILNS